jgi:hypothetical protein
MDVTFKKKKDVLEGEVALRSMDLEDAREGVKGEIENCVLEDKFITISPECVRCKYLITVLNAKYVPRHAL